MESQKAYMYESKLFVQQALCVHGCIKQNKNKSIKCG